MERRKLVAVVLKYFSIYYDWGAIEDTDILTALEINQSFFKKKFKGFFPSKICTRLKHGEPDSSEKLPDQKLHEKFFLKIT